MKKNFYWRMRFGKQEGWGRLRAVVVPRWPGSAGAKQSAEERADRAAAPGEAGTHLGELPELVGVQQQLLQAAGIAVNLLGDVHQRAVALVDGLHMTVAPPQGNAVEHRRPRRCRRRSRVPSRGARGSEPAPPGRPAAPRSLLAPGSLAPRKGSTVPNARRKPREPSPRPAPSLRRSVPSHLPHRCTPLPTRGCRALGMRTQPHAEGVSRPGMLRSGFSWRPGSREGRGESGFLRSLPSGNLNSVGLWREPCSKKDQRRTGTESQRESQQLPSFSFTHCTSSFRSPSPKQLSLPGSGSTAPQRTLSLG